MTPGSIAWVVRSLRDWTFSVRQGMALVTYRSSRAREVVLRELREPFEAKQWRVETLQCPECRPEELVGRITTCEADVLFVLDPDRVLFGEQNELSPAWINFHRETLVEHRGVQIWWMPPDAAIRFGRELPDLNRFFLLREDLTEDVELGQTAPLTLSDARVVGDDTRGNDYLERALRAVEAGADASRVWLELGIPAIDAFLDAGRMKQAVDAFARLRVLAGDPEQVLSKAINPPDHELGRAFRTLGDLYRLVSYWMGDPGRGAMQAITYYDRALGLVNPEQSTLEWASTQTALGIAYLFLPTGDRSDNVRRAIKYFDATLRVCTEQEFPKTWASTITSLGTAYLQLSIADGEENVHRALECFEAALRVLTERDDPYAWASVQNNLGEAYARLPTGDRGENLEKVIKHYQAALRVWTPDSYPQDWAIIQLNIGHAYASLPTGDRGHNLKRAIACYEAALKVCTRQNSREGWATAQNNLGVAFSEMPAGDRASNLRRAIEYYQAALSVYQADRFQGQRDGTSRNLQKAREELEKLSQQPEPA